MDKFNLLYKKNTKMLLNYNYKNNVLFNKLHIRYVTYRSKR